jgi:sugar phosphate permease
MLMTSQLGGALASLLVPWIQVQYGWRASFFAFGVAGILWCAVWNFWYRDSPAEKPGVTQGELDEMKNIIEPTHRQLPWSVAVKSTNFWAILGVALCYLYTFSFFQSWMHTYLVKGQGFSEQQLRLSSLPFFVAAGANLCGGLLSNALVNKIGLKWGRRLIGLICLGISAIATVALMVTHSQMGAIVLLCVIYGGITIQQPIMFAVCLDIGGPFAGATTGAMNTAAQVGGLISTVAFGYLVQRSGDYDLPFVPMALLLCLGALLWLKIDATRPLIRQSAAVL